MLFICIERHSNTLATNTLTCGALLSVGDIIQQRIEKAMDMQKNNKHDMARTGNFCAESLLEVNLNNFI